MAVLIVVFIAMFSMIGCKNTINARPAATTAPAAATTAKLTIDSLKNLEYKVEYTQNGVAKLENGEYQEAAAPGSATKIVVQLTGYIAFGDLNNDKVEDSAVILVSQPGGSGTFYDLASVLNKDGNLKSTNSIFLGDRIKIKIISINSGIITVNYLERKEDQAMADEPTVDKTQTFIVENDILSPTVAATTSATSATSAATTATTTATTN